MPIKTERMPACLQDIYQATNAHRAVESNLDALRPLWRAHAAQARKLVPEAHIEANGEALYLGALSPGCRACKEGTWDCVFITMRCHLDCPFCYSPHAIAQDYIGSVFGTTPAQIAANHARTHITGIGFSGGEPFLEPQTLFDWIGWFKGNTPDKYYWVYTNGLLADEHHLRQLKELGVDEIRFNMAATGYQHPTVLKHLAAAVRLIPTVSIEIPAIPEHADRLLSCLSGWDAMGIRFLNLHELLYEPGTNSASLPGPRQAVVMPDGHHSAIHPGSRALTLTVMRTVQEHGLSLSVNDCSLQGKLGQLRGRRQSIAPLVKAPYEKWHDETLTSCCAFTDERDYFFLHPDSLGPMRQQFPGHRFVRLARAAPLSLQTRTEWVLFQELD